MKAAEVGVTTESEELVVRDLPEPPAASAASLVGGLISDVQRLVRQEIALVRQEALEQLGRLKRASTVLIPAVVLLAVSVSALVQALAHGAAALLQWPLWAAYLGVSGILAAGGLLGIAIHARRA